MKNVAIVVGASGVTGTPMAEQLLLAGWKVYGVSRREPRLSAGANAQFRHIKVDLTDTNATHAALAGCGDITHVFYCANDGRHDAKVAMIGNVLAAVEAAAPGFACINLLQGLKYNGSHLGPFKTPAKESDPRIPGGDFYYSEEDLVLKRQQGKRWAWTAVRPSSVCGYASGNPMNLATVLAIYGSILRELGLPFGFPGTTACFDALRETIDAEMLARSAIWVSTKGKCGNQAYNVSNGDMYRWRHLWPALARFFELEPQGPQPYSLAEFMTDKQPLWDSITPKYGLAPFPFAQIVNWVRGSFTPPNSRFACEYDFISDTLKIRRCGFHEVMETEQMFLRLFARFRAVKVIP